MGLAQKQHELLYEHTGIRLYIIAKETQNKFSENEQQSRDLVVLLRLLAIRLSPVVPGWFAVDACD